MENLHCWHTTGKDAYTCCWCARARIAIRLTKPLEGHGPHAELTVTYTGYDIPWNEKCPKREGPVGKLYRTQPVPTLSCCYCIAHQEGTERYFQCCQHPDNVTDWSAIGNGHNRLDLLVQ